MNRREFLKKVGLISVSGLVLPYVPKISYFDMGRNATYGIDTFWTWKELGNIETYALMEVQSQQIFTIIFDSCLPSRDRDTLENQMMKRFGINKNQLVL